MQHLQPNATLQGGKYRIERVLGQGGFGITYLATQISLNRYVAIKELFIGGSGQAINDRRGNMVIVTNSANQTCFNQQREKFKKEALRLANLNHPNLVKVHELFEENGTAYYVMDYIEGESLRTKLNREGVLSESLVLKYLQQLLPALDAAHKQSIWHLDIKPENIMVDRYNHVYLIDFGASKHIEPNSTLTTSLVLAYTPGYCPPELLDLSNETPEYYLQAIRDIGPWTDIYALGATMYNLLTDTIPPSKRRLDKEGRNAFMFPSNVSSSTQDLITWMMKPQKEDRPSKTSLILESLSGNGNYEDTLYEPNPIGLMIDNHEAIDLGLSVLWAKLDIGASELFDNGQAFLWGDANESKAMKLRRSMMYRLFGSCPSIGNLSGNIIYDTATYKWGKEWRTPTVSEFKELAYACEWKLIDMGHVKITGPNGNSIVLNGQWHWTSENYANIAIPFSWRIINDKIDFSFPNDYSQAWSDFYLPIRPVTNK